MSECDRLIYINIDRFLYDLAEGLGQSDENIQKNCQNFWQKIYGEKFPDEKLADIKASQALTADYRELLTRQYEPFASNYDGYYYPVKIGDTYALQMECAGKIVSETEKSTPKVIKEQIPLIKRILDSQLHPFPATLGESWLIWGQIPSDTLDPDSLETIAKTCYESLDIFPTSKWDRDFKNAGEFQGVKFYELWRVPGDSGNLNQNYHLLICLFPHNSGTFMVNNPQFQQMITSILPLFIELFHFRNKIIWAYTQSRQLKVQMKQASQEIQAIINGLPQQVKSTRLDLKEMQITLQKCLTIFSGYASHISELEEQQQTIATNLHNYKKQLTIMPEALNPKWKGDRSFQFLNSFSKYTQEKYIPQIQADLASLSAELRLLENAIKTIEGIIQLEQTKSDRALSETVAIATVGLGLSAITATVVSTQHSLKCSQPAEGDRLPEECDRFFLLTAPFGWSILIFLPFLIWLFWRLRRPAKEGKRGIFHHSQATPPDAIALPRGEVGFEVGNLKNSNKDAINNDITHH
ncbi:hypothetical protein [Laspinema olomoucense]|uniref:hypothetical protein n=1 Tax=Laspinema olomoucense TaxID=3231600 RepID=UPI0021BB1AB2|nr:hypothetical protein [Laspinema sp. D3c]MCT7992718.1 hypothetical protein [Laspinema sp. D3c]